MRVENKRHLALLISDDIQAFCPSSFFSARFCRIICFNLSSNTLLPFALFFVSFVKPVLTNFPDERVKELWKFLDFTVKIFQSLKKPTLNERFLIASM